MFFFTRTDAIEQLSLQAKFAPQTAGNSVSEGLDLKIFWDPDPLEMTRNVMHAMPSVLDRIPIQNQGD